MTGFRTHLLLSAALFALVPAQAFAQDSAQDSAQSEPAAAASVDDNGNEIIVTGTRAAGRTKLDSAAPVDVLSADSLKRQGTSELAASLSSVAPSVVFPRSSAVDGTDSIRPATLRGLSPDQTLVLINGTRTHPSALLNINGSVGRGAAAVDLNTIPTVALDRVEVLRDGASAQYGSDAIAGVINLRLKQASSGGGVTASYGQYVTDVEAARSSRKESDGEAFQVAAWQGFKLGADGFLTLSGEYVDRNPTSRGDIDPRTLPASPAVLRSRFGDPDVKQYTGYYNAALPLGDNIEFYSFGGYQHRKSVSAAFPRVPGNANNVLSIYPDGFLPLINVKSNNYNIAAGLRGESDGWDIDFTLAYGRNALDFRTTNSINSTYGANSPTEFDDGGLVYDQWVGGVDFTKQYPLGNGNLNVALGWEFRQEGYKIIAGEDASHDRGPLGGNASLGSGAQGFPGFRPSNAIEKNRQNVAAYLDLEARLADSFTIGAAVRGEHYSDFGAIATGKISARYDIAPWLALRGTASTGFRAPSLQQQYFTSTASVFVAPDIVETGTFPSVSAIAVALGGLPLEPEKSTNLSVGTVIRTGGFSLTVDAYQIKLRDQLGLSENIAAGFSEQVRDILAPYGVSAARFFLNGIRTKTRGIDVVANYKLRTDSVGTFDLTAAANFNDIKVQEVPTSTAVNLDPVPTLFTRQRIVSIEEGTPRTKIVGTIDWTLGGFGLTARASHYGNVTQPSNNPADDIFTGRKTIFDLEGRYQVTDNIGLALGANNLFDTYPDKVPLRLNSSGVVAFPYYSPFGFNGRYLYGRVNVTW